MQTTKTLWLVLSLALLAGAVEIRAAGDGVQLTPRVITVPVYPAALRKAKIKGNVVVEFIVGTDGYVHQATVVEATDRRFNQAALDAISSWRFNPPLQSGRPTSIRAQQELAFSVPVLVHEPVYPYAQLLAGQDGTATLGAWVDENNQLKGSMVLKASEPAFGKAALANLEDAYAVSPSLHARPTYGEQYTTSYSFKCNGSGDVNFSASAKEILKLLQEPNASFLAPADLDKPLVPLENEPPLFPLALRATHTVGSAVVEFFIDREGVPQMPRTVETSHEDFAYAAVQAVAAWRFEPPLKHGQPVIVRTRMPVAFKLSGTEDDAPDQQPKMLSAVRPEYPAILKSAGLIGNVTLDFTVDKEGRVLNPAVVESNDPQFEEPAIAAIMKWKFQPARKIGRPVNSQVRQVIKFTLDQPDPPTLIKSVRPEYPLFIGRAGLIGSVTIDFVVDTNGQVINPYVVESNNPWFERPSIDAILQWKFQPALQAGHPVNFHSSQTFSFSLYNGGGEAPDLWTVTKSKEHDKLPLALQWNTPPTPVSTMFPVYPLEQLQAGLEGQVRIEYTVGPEGRVVAAKPLEATTPEFGLAVLAMIDAWRFHPAKKKDGTLAYAKLTTEYAFRTNGRGDVPVSEEAQRILKDIKKRPESIVALKDLDQPPKPLSRRPPVYPTALEKAGQPGQAMIEFFIDYKGDVQLPRIVSATAPEFGYAAAQAVATWRFEPPMQKGKKVIARVKIPVDFKVYERRTDGTAEKIPEFPEPRP